MSLFGIKPKKIIKNPVIGTERLAAFSDGVFAIAITLLVLDLRVPDIIASKQELDKQLGDALVKELPDFFAYITSFVIIGFYWLAHHRIFSYIEHTNRRLATLNLFFLLLISFLPFPTILISRYSPSGLPETIYASAMLLTGVSLALIWVYATQERRLVAKDLAHDVVIFNLLRCLNPPLVFALSILVNYIFPNSNYASFTWLLLIITSNLIKFMYVDREESPEENFADPEESLVD